jgi:septal ring-binding cell division protein DamX
MASRDKKNGGDFVLESRHLVGLFLLLVVIFGVVFTLGYMLGRSQYDARLRAAVSGPAESEVQADAPAAKTKPRQESETAQVPKSSSDWDFYHSADAPQNEDHLEPAPKPVNVSAQPAASPKPAATAKIAKPGKSSTGADGSLIPKGSIMLQVAAVLHQGDALALAQALQKKKFPAFVLTPSTDKYYRVQVGPYADNQSATKARADLEANGFESIVKR